MVSYEKPSEKVREIDLSLRSGPSSASITFTTGSEMHARQPTGTPNDSG